MSFPSVADLPSFYFRRYYQRHMKVFLTIIGLSVALQAQSLRAGGSLPDATRPHHFWTLENKVNFSILTGLIAADGITTQRGLNEGLREVNPVIRPLVTRGAPGEAAASALGLGLAVGAVYWLHRSHHYKAEHLAMRLIVAGEACFVANNLIAIR